jgi:hypothetical protein
MTQLGLEPKEQKKIDSTFRNGSLTAIGIILGFCLSFINRWASNPNDWSRIDILPMLLMVAGIVIQVKAFSDLLARDSLLAVKYDRARRVFMLGFLIVAVGIAIALANDILGISHQTMIG